MRNRTSLALAMACFLFFLNGVSALATTHYISSTVGADSNNGTSKATPWAHAPGMTGCSNSCSAYAPSAGDSIILKGGDTWQVSGNPNWNWTWSGTSGKPIYVGVDTTWYAGANNGTVNTNGTTVTWVSGNAFQMNGSWDGGAITINGQAYAISSVPNPYVIILTTSAGTQAAVSYSNSLFKRPIIDGQGQTSKIISAFVGYVTFDSLELTGAMDQTANQDGSFNAGHAAGNVTLANADVHNFRYCTGNGTPTSYCTGALTDNSGSSGGVEVALSSSLSGSGMTLMNSNVGSPESGGGYGACSKGMQVLANNYIHDCSQANLHGGTLVHDNIVSNVGKTFDGTTHTNGFYLDCLAGTCTGGSFSGNLTSYVYNNWIQNMQGNASATAIYPNPGTSDGGSASTVTYYVFNNVVSNAGSGAVGQIGDEIDPYGAPSGMTMNVYDWNNTYELSSNLACVNVVARSVPMNVVDVRNFHCIQPSTPSSLFSAGGTINPKSIDILGQSITTANSQGDSAPLWSETSSAESTVGAGTNLTSFCSGSLTALCSGTTLGGYQAAVARSSSGAWDEGAYQFSPNTPLPPSGLQASVQ